MTKLYTRWVMLPESVKDFAVSLAGLGFLALALWVTM